MLLTLAQKGVLQSTAEMMRYYPSKRSVQGLRVAKIPADDWCVNTLGRRYTKYMHTRQLVKSTAPRSHPEGRVFVQVHVPTPAHAESSIERADSMVSHMVTYCNITKGGTTTPYRLPRDALKSYEHPCGPPVPVETSPALRALLPRPWKLSPR
jgi:hypothetical protein